MKKNKKNIKLVSEECQRVAETMGREQTDVKGKHCEKEVREHTVNKCEVHERKTIIVIEVL